jgi:uncharacterized protein (DUF697 family)
MATQQQINSAHLIIHSCAAASATAAGAWSAIPFAGPFSMMVGADTPVLASITAGMVVSLGKLFGQSLTKGAAMGVVGNLLGLVFGVNIARGLMSLIPGAGTMINAATTATLQETIGWAFFYIFDEGKDPTKMTAEEIYKCVK